MIIVGIDNGLDGGIFVGEAKSKREFVAVQSYVMPVRKGGSITRFRVDPNQLLSYLPTQRVRTYVLIERPVGSKNMKAARSMWDSFGITEAICLARYGSEHVEYVKPKTWQRALLSPTYNTKDESRRFVQSKWPKWDFLANARCRSPHLGMTDAACIAYYNFMLRGLEMS